MSKYAGSNLNLKKYTHNIQVFANRLSDIIQCVMKHVEQCLILKMILIKR